MVRMTMNWLKLLSVVGCGILALTFGSAAVFTAKPIGEKPAGISSEDWEGVWVGKGIVKGLAIYIEVPDEENGKIRTLWFDDLGNGEFKLQKRQVYLTESAEGTFISMREPAEPEQNERYLLGRLRKGEGLIMIWLPDAPKLEALVEEGILPGTVEHGSVILGELTAEHMELITTSAEGVLFEWESPVGLLLRIED